MRNESNRAEALEKRLFALFLEENQETAAEFVRDSVFDDDDNRRDDASQALFLNFFEDLRSRFCEFVVDALENPAPVATHAEFVSGLCLDTHAEWEEEAQRTQDPTAWENEALWASAAYNLQEVDDS